MIKSILLLAEEQGIPSFDFDPEEILNCIMNDSRDCIAIKDKLGRYIWINNSGASFLNRSVEDVIGKTDFELFDVEAALMIRKSDMEVMSQGSSETYTAYLKPKHAAGKEFMAIKRAYKNKEGQVQGIINIVRDSDPRAAQL